MGSSWLPRLPKGSWTWALAVALLAPARPAAAEVSEPPAESFTDEVAVGYVLVPVVVRSGDGYVSSLKDRDFRLLIDGEEVPFDSFEKRADAPISVVFLQDLSGSMEAGGKLAASREAVRFFLDQAVPADEFAIASFAGEQIQVEVPFTNDLGALAEDLETWEAYGKTALHDAVSFLPDISAGGTHAKRAAILITDGTDNASTIPPAEARELVRQAQVPVYVLGLGSGSPYDLRDDGQKQHRFADVLNLLALMSGGRYFAVAGPNDLKEAIVAIAEDLRHQYVLGFTTTGSGKEASRRIKVEVTKKNVKVLSRQSYHGTLPRVPTVRR